MIARKAVLANIDIMPDEHILGPLGRLYLYSSYKSIGDATFDISLDSKSLTPGVVWRESYRDIAKHWQGASEISEFIERHTLVNLYNPFLPLQHELDDNSKVCLMPTVHRVIRNTMTWRYCSVSVDEDFEARGFPYFHLEHQLPGASYCQKHGNALKGGCLGCGNNWQKLELIKTPSSDDHCNKCATPISAIYNFRDEDADWVQQTAFKLLNGENSSLTLRKLQKAYRDWLGIGERQGVLKLKERRIVEEGQEFVDNKFDPRLYSLFFTNAKEGHSVKRSSALSLYQAAFNDSAFLSPIVHLVLIRAMYGELDNIPNI
ncbi:hypothetical protein ACHSBP_19445 [Pseudoalteromonas sp. XMcav1-K]|uniref:hypothetical protein n=1 Tax=Pseudoalteromonas sp. XMcav1-K TaxID=3374372 RepID=UPI0037575BC0